MFKKIKEKLKKHIEKVEKKDIEYIKKHPLHWKMLLIFIPSVLILLSILLISAKPSFIIVVLIFIYPYYLIEKEMLNRYKKALKIS